LAAAGQIAAAAPLSGETLEQRELAQAVRQAVSCAHYLSQLGLGKSHTITTEKAAEDKSLSPTAF
jgi:hypothetical protein